jgi:hypothetical protein
MQIALVARNPLFKRTRVADRPQTKVFKGLGKDSARNLKKARKFIDVSRFLTHS